MFENEILFDDAAVLDASLGKGYPGAGPVKNDCDCSSYTDTQDDEGSSTPEGA